MNDFDNDCKCILYTCTILNNQTGYLKSYIMVNTLQHHQRVINILKTFITYVCLCLVETIEKWCSNDKEILSCLYTSRDGDLKYATGVVFHHTNIEIDKMPTQKFPNQKWVFYTHVSMPTFKV